jgi:hypothetical protein
MIWQALTETIENNADQMDYFYVLATQGLTSALQLTSALHKKPV